MARLDDVKLLLGIKDAEQDELIKLIENLTVSHFVAYINKELVPPECDFIITEVMVKRFNRIGSEGLTNQSVEGLSQTFSAHDFEEYDTFLSRYFGLNTPSGGIKIL
ncbi:phage head-tail adapter protein [Suicoccus acidiformans]|uniref:Phage head-tail adapter protein n=1 Tax=Suicoccus acidiformans TaxID=2036206 RepID=A0A347WIK3_9LACT|nr:phage head-tail connector protein [Suicoccus acidiformans]AXY24910.1 phage head-tail adapter protein [Suicoccus acidiformans]